MNCSICFENSDNKFVTTKCGHNFHKKCLDAYLIHQNKSQQNTNCPLCRTNLNTYFDQNCISRIKITAKGISYQFNGSSRFLPLPFPK